MKANLLPLHELGRHPDNARETDEYARKNLAGLMASIQEHGLLQPLVVTPGRDGYRILAGHRRHAALKALRIEEAPCVVLEADDQEALAVLLTENASHKPVDPLKEAESVAKLVEGFAGEKHPHDRAAAVLGKSLSWVRGRLRLTTLSPAWREAHADGEGPVHEWPVGHLELLAALPEAIQDQVLEHYQGAFHDAVPLLSELRRTVADHTRTLDHVPWDPNAPDVAEGTPPCTACPRRESAQGGLFDGISRTKGDRCLDVTCFTRKRAAFVLSRIQEARAKHGDALAVEVGWGSPDVPLPEGIATYREHELVPLAKAKGGTPVLRLRDLKVAYMGRASRRIEPGSSPAAQPLDAPRTGPKSLEDRRKDLDRRRLVRALSLLRGSLLGQPVDVGTDRHPEQVTPPELGVPALEDLIALVVTGGTGRSVSGEVFASGSAGAEVLRSVLAETRSRSKDAALRVRQSLWDLVRGPLSRVLRPLPGMAHGAVAENAALAEVLCELCGADWKAGYLEPAVEAMPEPRAWAANVG